MDLAWLVSIDRSIVLAAKELIEKRVSIDT